jgi:glycosyltransferase involved in cell wall biosynthesis
MTTPARPRISIVIPTYNYAATLPRAVASVLTQASPDVELIVVDDGSTDDTPQVAERLLAEHAGRFRYSRKPNGGPSSARNRGVAETRGEYLVFLDADDEFAPDALALIEAHLLQHPETRVVIGGHLAISPDGNRVEHHPGKLPDDALSRLRAYLLDKSLYVSNGACVMHRDVFALGGYPEGFRSAEDIPIFAHAVANFPCTLLDRPLVWVHKHDDSLRNQFRHAKAGGLALVDEVFSEKRLGERFQTLKRDFYVQRCLSLFRSAYLAGDFAAAREFYWRALCTRPTIVGKLSYTSKALRLLWRR